MNTIDHEQMPYILLDKIYLYTILSIDTIYILSLFHCQIPLTLLFTPTTYLFNYYTCYIYITIYSSLLLSNIHKYIHIYTLTKPLFLLSTTIQTHHSNPYSTFYLYFHYYYSPTHSLTITIIHPYHYHQSLHSVISNIFTVI